MTKKLVCGVMLLGLFAPSSDLTAQAMRVQEVKWEDLPEAPLSEEGQRALNIRPGRWRYAVTEHFVLHFRRIAEAVRTVRFIDHVMEHTAEMLGFEPEAYQTLSRAYVFEDEAEWMRFLLDGGYPTWIGSFAKQDELFLSIRRQRQEGGFDHFMLAHETVHAAVARLYPEHRWPLWLNEGFAEYAGRAAVAAERGARVQKDQDHLPPSSLVDLETIQQIEMYPSDPILISSLYRSSEAVVRFMLNTHPPEKFRMFVDAHVVEGKDFEAAIMLAYGQSYGSFEEFAAACDEFRRTQVR
ncbi:MAG: hypothetical protein ACFCU3_00485 [Verrucomicrobiales bacterium]